MSDSYTIHVRPKGDAQAADFIHDVEAVIGATFSPDALSAGLIAWTTNNVVYAFVEDVDFEDDGNVPFSRYPWFVEQTPSATESARHDTQEHMRVIYQALVDTGRYGCCLVYALSELLANNEDLTSDVMPG